MAISLMPNGERASTTAFITAAGDAIVHVSPTPFTPSGLSVAAVSVRSSSNVGSSAADVFGASLAIGALSGLAQFGTRSSFDASAFGDAYRQAAGSSLAASAGRVLDRYLNVLPTITIREGYRIKVYLTNDLQLPPYPAPVAGGVR